MLIINMLEKNQIVKSYGFEQCCQQSYKKNYSFLKIVEINVSAAQKTKWLAMKFCTKFGRWKL